MPTALDPSAFAAKMNEWKRGTMIEAHGTRFLTAGQGRAVAQLDFTPALRQLTGLFHAGAIIALADETATAAAMWETNPTADFTPERFPLTLQLSVNLIRNTNRGTLTAEAQVLHRGRTTIIVDVKVSDDQQRLIASMVATLLVPTSGT
jgi:1,4-dihydroxy-2-naphthoyl-CoA hydrolase